MSYTDFSLVAVTVTSASISASLYILDGKRHLRINVSACNRLAGVPGFEPRVTASEAVALPFGDTPKEKSTLCSKSDPLRQDFLDSYRLSTHIDGGNIGRLLTKILSGHQYQ